MLRVIGIAGLVAAPQIETAFAALEALPLVPNRVPRFEQAADDAALSPGGGTSVGTGAICRLGKSAYS